MEQVDDPLAEIAYKDAAKIEPDFEVGEELYEEIDIMILAAVQYLPPNKHWPAVSVIWRKMYW